ncbi:hypothetical protein P678_3753 [Acinetobacter baumannii UH7807]|uniref:Uncharacterized protein n=5 Tax=Acinetobacter baumannii TaxID=470 RepID=A0A828STE2_ACIBA|nr:hypothetical protein ACICU_02622 [Acinetobacter baumannii ACICU]ADX04380.1 Hypothetical protein ABK1_2746 [Acinetobacter baumannii 1656-2]AFI94712.1 hypothetical protein ABTJ_01091 [Acinetobacter baumannii MDR-TJ]AFU38977.1 hypothetical protein M3Q_2889 [Acinetobacter baumannii TYTH-1]AGQ11211.1 hypothetical protein BJAB0868_02662 [Acinetobacter baumannii BJAB0868]AGQ15149.1 hypothetical protein BJAB07104_02781 [Acinetobacter baumannii BJAB07104]AHJ94079.1 hypothetical protein U476_13685 [
MSNKINQTRKITSGLVKSHYKTLLDALNLILNIIRLLLEIINILFL